MFRLAEAKRLKIMARVKPAKEIRLFILLAVMVVGAAFFYAYQRRVVEPVYNGKPLSFWLENYDFPPDGNQPSMVNPDFLKADAALDHVGTNAIPTLLRMLAAKDSRVLLKLIDLTERQHFITIHYAKTWHQNYAAISGFAHLGDAAKQLVPVQTWIDIYDQHPSAMAQSFIAEALAERGAAAEPAVPSLLRMGTNTNADFALRVIAIVALGRIHAKPESVVPALIQATQDKNIVVREAAIDNLGRFGADARPAVSALIKLLTDTDPNIVEIALYALEKIDPTAAKATGRKSADSLSAPSSPR